MKAKKDKLVLIDGNSMVTRAFYATFGPRAMKTKDGFYTNAIYGFLNILFKVLKDHSPKYLVVSFDISRPKERLELYPEYKAGRDKMPEELKAQYPKIKKILQDMNIDIVEYPEVEADDVIGTLAKYGEENDLEVVIISGDRDTFQLATDNVSIEIPRTKNGESITEIYDKKEIINKYGVTPKQLIDVKGLQGDSSDNIPGVPGVGEKTALKLISEYESIENLYEKLDKNLDNLKGKLREKLAENKELAILSKKLGTINTNIKIDHDLENFKVEEWNKKVLFEDFKELGFNSFINRYNLDEDTQTLKQNENSIEYKIENLKEVNKPLDEIRSEILNDGKIIYDIVTKELEDSNQIIKKEITHLVILNSKKDGVYFIELKDIISFGIYTINDPNYPNKNENNEVYKFLKDIFENKDIKKYSHEISEQYILFKQIGITISNIYFDSKIGAYILNPSDQRYSLNDLSLLFLNYELKQKQVEKQLNLFESNGENNFDDSQSKDNLDKQYYKGLVFVIYKLIDIIEQKLKEIESYELFRKIEIPTIAILANMQWNGIYADKSELVEYAKELEKHIEELTNKIYELAGEEFNISSPKQLSQILFEKLKLKTFKRTKTRYSTDNKVLEKLVNEHEIIKYIIDYRGYTKLYSTYAIGLQDYINPITNRIHSTFTQTVTATGRISSIEPNLQNIPTRTELGKQLRKVFKAGPGNVFVDGDYSQIELRVLASISMDPTMVHAFENGLDIHKMAASKVYGVSLDEVTDKMRSSAKAVNFGIVYGISDFGLAEQLNIKQKEAKELITQYLEQYDGIKKYLDDVVNDAKQDGFTKTLLNRRRYIPELRSQNKVVEALGKRIAMNAPIQGTAADIMKIAMINVSNKIEEQKLKSKIVLQVHDEMIVQVPDDEKEIFAKILKEQMEIAVKLNVPLIVNVEEASNWYDCK